MEKQDKLHWNQALLFSDMIFRTLIPGYSIMVARVKDRTRMNETDVYGCFALENGKEPRLALKTSNEGVLSLFLQTHGFADSSWFATGSSRLSLEDVYKLLDIDYEL